ncbi:unnamed protein product [Rotaria sp. Silwood1]|nr:unnamed protein product [Rotaria sp. Silwood1]CAF4636032.1 unnamed protein product [Rotaria sp. Silwood1]
MPRLRELALTSLSSNGSKTNVFEQIRILHFDTNSFIGKKDEKRLFRMFTRVERLYIHGEMQSRRQMARFIDGFHFLSYGSFEFEWLTTVQVDETQHWLVKNTRRLTHDNFTYRIDGSCVHLWIGDKDNKQDPMKNIDLRAGIYLCPSLYRSSLQTSSNECFLE